MSIRLKYTALYAAPFVDEPEPIRTCDHGNSEACAECEMIELWQSKSEHFA